MKLIPKLIAFSCVGLSLFAAFFYYVTNPAPQKKGISSLPERTVDAPATTTTQLRRKSPESAPTPTPIGYLSRTAVGGKWPLLVEDGVVRCNRLTGGVVVVIFRSGDKTYAVNGMAKSRIDQFGWEDITAIQNMEKTDAGLLKYPITPILDMGLSLCP